MRIRDVVTNELSESTFIDDIEFGMIPTLPPGEYQVEFDDCRVAQLCRVIGGRETWSDYRFTIKG